MVSRGRAGSRPTWCLHGEAERGVGELLTKGNRGASLGWVHSGLLLSFALIAWVSFRKRQLMLMCSFALRICSILDSLKRGILSHSKEKSVLGHFVCLPACLNSESAATMLWPPVPGTEPRSHHGHPHWAARSSLSATLIPGLRTLTLVPTRGHRPVGDAAPGEAGLSMNYSTSSMKIC